MKILFVSLGCDKNLVDTEVMLGILFEKGYTFTERRKKKVYRQFYLWRKEKKADE